MTFLTGVGSGALLQKKEHWKNAIVINAGNYTLPQFIPKTITIQALQQFTDLFFVDKISNSAL
jgi:hypothetical protein